MTDGLNIYEIVIVVSLFVAQCVRNNRSIELKKDSISTVESEGWRELEHQLSVSTEQIIQESETDIDSRLFRQMIEKRKKTEARPHRSLSVIRANSSSSIVSETIKPTWRRYHECHGVITINCHYEPICIHMYDVEIGEQHKRISSNNN